MGTEPESALRIDPETMRAMGYAAVDRLVEHLRDPRSKPVIVRATPEEMAARIWGPPPEAAADTFGEVLEELFADVLAFTAREDHPGFLGFIPGSGAWPSAIGDFVAAATSVYAGSWMEGAGPTMLELLVLEWFRSWLGMPEGSSGLLVGGGSAANLTALACARESLLGPMSERAVMYAGDQAHSSIARASRALGFGPDQLRILPTDRELRMSPDELAAAIDRDRAAGRRPLVVVAMAGSTNTGVVDPLAAIADVCRSRRIWLHVDAAYGGFACLTERGRKAMAGIEQADSVTMDPHKWFFQSYECGAVIVRSPELLQRAFQIVPDYLHDAEARSGEVNLSDRGLQLTRTARAIKVWMTVRTYGLGALRRTIERSMALADHAQARIESEPSLELMHPASLSVVCFRRRVENGSEEDVTRANAYLVEELERSGRALVTTTRLGGRSSVRIAITNHSTERQDVDAVLDHFALSDVPAQAAAIPKPYESWQVAEGWIGRRRPRFAALASLDVFAGVDADVLGRICDATRIESVPAGRTIVRHRDPTRDFFVVLEGRVQIEREGEVLGISGPGDFFGELAALDWGAGFGYSRLATVVALEDVSLLVLTSVAMNELLKDAPTFEERIRAAIAERMPTVRPEG